MSERTTDYVLVEEDGDETVVRITERFCRCGGPTCVFDRIELMYEGESDYTAEVPHAIHYVIVGLILGEFKMKEGS